MDGEGATCAAVKKLSEEARQMSRQEEEDLEREVALQLQQEAGESGAWFARNYDRMVYGISSDSECGS